MFSRPRWVEMKKNLLSQVKTLVESRFFLCFLPVKQGFRSRIIGCGIA